jgi:hypothetical protein
VAKISYRVQSALWDYNPDFYGGSATEKGVSLGAIGLSKGTSVQAGIDEIFAKSENFAFDCATAITVIYWKAKINWLLANNKDLLKTLNKNTLGTVVLGGLNKGFPLVVPSTNKFVPEGKQGKQPLPGDVVAFWTPGAKEPAFEYENALYLGNGLYFALGFEGGMIFTKKQIEDNLFKLQKPGPWALPAPSPDPENHGVPGAPPDVVGKRE